MTMRATQGYERNKAKGLRWRLGWLGEVISQVNGTEGHSRDDTVGVGSRIGACISVDQTREAGEGRLAKVKSIKGGPLSAAFRNGQNVRRSLHRTESNKGGRGGQGRGQE